MTGDEDGKPLELPMLNYLRPHLAWAFKGIPILTSHPSFGVRFQ